MFLERRYACWAGLAPESRVTAIRDFQSRQLRAIVGHAYARVPYYRRLFDHAGLKPHHVRGVQDLSRIPFTSRADLQRCDPAEIVARGINPQRLVVHRTSGSSGQPLSIRRTAFEDRMLQAYRLKVLFHLGLRLRDRRAAVVTQRLFGPALYNRLGILRYEEIHCLLSPQRILARLRDIRPDVLRGFAGTLSWLTTQMSEGDRQTIRPRFVTTDSELLTSDMRERIQAGFGAPVIDFYDSHEFNMIAWQRPHTGDYQLAAQSVLAEVLQDNRAVASGEQGEFVGTALHSWAMPFIRFRLGDVVTLGEAPWTLREIQGRLIDRFVLPDRSTIHPFVLVNPLLHNAPWLLQYQLVQELPDRIRVKLVPMPGAHPTTHALESVRKVLGDRLGATVSVEIELTDHIPADATGKFRPYYRA
jgi:phenylacetate-CoA ligase